MPSSRAAGSASAFRISITASSRTVTSSLSPGFNPSALRAALGTTIWFLLLIFTDVATAKPPLPGSLVYFTYWYSIREGLSGLAARGPDNFFNNLSEEYDKQESRVPQQQQPTFPT